jgi:tRNA (guanine10-N2)-methyltransferase
MQTSFCFRIDSFNHTRTLAEQKDLIESFSYMDFQGPIRLRDAEQIFTVHEVWTLTEPKKLLRVYLGRYVSP